MKHGMLVFILVAIAVSEGCRRQPDMEAENTPLPHGNAMRARHHEVVDIERWIRLFPLKDFEKREGPRRYTTTNPDDPIDLGEEDGHIIISPADLAVTEQVRRRVGKTHDLGKVTPTDLFLFAVGEPKLPYLTKVGGIPYRPAEKPWPTSKDGTPLAFFTQFCFLDSKDILPPSLPGDVMLLFVRDSDSLHDSENKDGYCIEWSRVPLANPITAGQCPKTRLVVPNYYGTIYRTNEYPESKDIFEREGHDSFWLFATTQATRIGGETWFIQNDPRRKGETLLCTFSCVYLKDATRFPFVNVESAKQFSKEHRDAMEINLGDAGRIYFLMDATGTVRWEADCY